VKILVRSGLTVCCLVYAAPLLAQSAPTTPGLFAGNASDAHTHVMASIAEAYDRNNDPEANGPALSLVESSGFYTAFAGELGYYRETARTRFGANIGSESRYYSKQQEFIGVNQYGDVSFEATFRRRTNLSIRQGVSYSPAYFSGFFPSLSAPIQGDASVRGGDFATSDLNALSVATVADISHGLTRRGTLSFTSFARRTMFNEVTGYDDLMSYAVGGRYQHQFTRNMSLRLGYTYREGQYGFVRTDANAAVHDIDVGLNYDRALSLSRRTQFEFAFGSALAQRGVATDTESGLRYHVVGHANLNHEFNRRWRARLAYVRGLAFVEGLPEPMFSDGVNASVTAQLSRRIDFSAQGGYNNGEVGELTSNTLKAYSASTRLRIGLNRFWAVNTEYVFYSYEIGSTVQLPVGVAPFRERSVVRVGLSLWVPFAR
jgi:hypothetical protein